MDFSSTVYRCSPSKEGIHERYDVRSKRVPIDNDEGYNAVAHLLLKERRQRRSNYHNRGHYQAKAEDVQQNGESGIWSVVDFTGKYHRPLMDEDPAHQIPGRAVFREDARPTGETRQSELDEKIAVIQDRHDKALQYELRHAATLARIDNYQSGTEMNIRAISTMVEKKVLLAEVAAAKEEEEEKDQLEHARGGGRYTAPPAVTDDESELLAATSDGREQTVRRLIRAAGVNPNFSDPATGATPLHLVWDQWGPRFGLKGALEALTMKDDPRYKAYSGLRDLSRVPRAEGAHKREATSPDSIEQVRAA